MRKYGLFAFLACICFPKSKSVHVTVCSDCSWPVWIKLYSGKQSIRNILIILVGFSHQLDINNNQIQKSKDWDKKTIRLAISVEAAFRHGQAIVDEQVWIVAKIEWQTQWRVSATKFKIARPKTEKKCCQADSENGYH